MIITTLLAKEEEIGGTINGLGPLGKSADFTQTITASSDMFGQVMSMIIGFLTTVAGIYFVFLFITAGISWMTAGGDKLQTENAQKKITTAMIGLFVVVAGIFIIDLFGNILGFEILSPKIFLENLWKP